MLAEGDLVGVWRLDSHHYLNGDGSTDEGPLGERPDGMLIYEARGYVSVAMMRTEDGPRTDGPVVRYMGYSGCWRVSDDLVIHEVAVSSDPRIVNTAQIREALLDHDGLTLRRRIDETPRYIVLRWQRIGED